tara:strand:+ start:276503 stop:276895 length:393 start_codon:yes stop_codon:yes gene_type:complete
MSSLGDTVLSFFLSRVGLLTTTVVLFGSCASLGVVEHMDRETLTVQVTDKERIVEGSGNSVSSRYLIFTDREVFENTDSLLEMKFSSSDLQGRLNVGSCYEIVVYGWRMPLVSSYRNVSDAFEVECPDAE